MFLNPSLVICPFDIVEESASGEILDVISFFKSYYLVALDWSIESDLTSPYIMLRVNISRLMTNSFVTSIVEP